MRRFSRSTSALPIAFAAALFVTASCSDSSGDGGSSSGNPSDASVAADGPASDSNTAQDAAHDALPDAAAICEGACKTTTLVATFGGKTGALDRAQHGIDHGDTGDTLHVEAHYGGDPKCPTQASPTPDRTLIVSGVPRTAAAGATFTEATGARVSFLDFKGDLLPTPLAKATAVTVKVVAMDAANPPAWTAFDVDATFADGTIKGHVYSLYCATLDD